MLCRRAQGGGVSLVEGLGWGRAEAEMQRQAPGIAAAALAAERDEGRGSRTSLHAGALAARVTPRGRRRRRRGTRAWRSTPTPRRCPPASRSAVGLAPASDRATGEGPASMVPGRRWLGLPSGASSPQGWLPPSVPRAAFSHSASVGRRARSSAQKAAASPASTHVTDARPCPAAARSPSGSASGGRWPVCPDDAAYAAFVTAVAETLDATRSTTSPGSSSASAAQPGSTGRGGRAAATRNVEESRMSAGSAPPLSAATRNPT